MKRCTAVLIALGFFGAALMVALPLIMFVVVMGGTADTSNSCEKAGDGTVVVAAPAGYELSRRQLQVAGVVIAVGRAAGDRDRAILVALAVASQESGFQNYANDGSGNDLAPDQRGIEESLGLQHDAVGTDHGSLGVFQQQWPWWGSIEELMNPETAAEKFYAALRKVPAWEDMAIGAAGQAVQRSAYPDAYADDVDLAQKLLAAAEGTGAITEAAYYGATADCASTAFAGEVVMPVAGSSYVDAKNFGHRGTRWSTTHTGTDFSTACGTPALASTGGVVTVRTDQAWAGRWLVTIDGGDGGVVTWYAHMQSVLVTSGDQVSAGEPIGSVGSEGNSTGCHLHFEVRPGGGNPVDPSVWLTESVGRSVPLSDTTAGASAVVMTANLPFWLSDAQMGQRVRGLLRTGPDVLMLQEVQDRDVAAMTKKADGQWGVWQPFGGGGHNAIVWSRDQFSSVRRGSEFGADLGGYQRWLPWLLLESQAGTLPVVNIHMPKNSTTDPDQRRHYKTMTRHYLELISELNESGLPPIVGGDWNEPLDRPLESWRPVRSLRGVGMTTNWQQGAPCASTDSHNRRIDGFAYNPDYVAVVGQGCLDRGPSDHRPVWIAVRPAE